MTHTTWKLSILCTFCLISSLSFGQSARTVAVREAVELASRKSGREIAQVSAREATENALARSAATFGDKALVAAADGGLELIEATVKYGDDVMKYALEASPNARRVFALNAETLLPLARRVGPEALEVEAKAPGLAGKVFTSFGDDAGKVIAKSVPADDLPRLVTYAEKADSQATRELLLQTYQKEGKTLFERIPAKLVLAGGLTASMLYGTHRVTKPAVAIADAIKDDPAAASDVAKYGIRIVGLIVVIVVVLLFWRFNLMPWHRHTAKHDSPATPEKASPRKNSNDDKQKPM
jgi:hypothetical protein